MQSSSIVHRLFFGLIIVSVGVIFLLNQLGIIEMGIGEIFSTFWPVFMIVFGIQALLMQSAGGGGYWWNPVVILLGIYFLGRNLGWFDWSIGDAIHIIWPIALILFGIGMIFQGGGKCSSKPPVKGNGEQWNPITPPTPSTTMPPMPPMPPGPPPAPPELEEFERRQTTAGPNLSKTTMSESDRNQHNGDSFYEQKQMFNEMFKEGKSQTKDKYKEQMKNKDWDWWEDHGWDSSRINHSRFIGDVHLGNEYWELEPMRISLFIGDTTLDLTKAQIPIGETKIYVSSFIGDVKVFVPNDFGVGIQVVSSCLIGDVKVLDQKRGGVFNHMSVQTPSYADTDKRIVLVVSSFIGDVRVTKVG